MITDAGGVEFAATGTFRADTVYRISGGLAGDRDLAELEQAGLQVVVDLRGAGEDRSLVERWAANRGVRYEHFPIVAVDQTDFRMMAAAVSTVTEGESYIDGFYLRIIDEYGPALAGTLSALADGLPAGFGCAAGKDRTGVVNALLDRLLGATIEEAAAHYLTRSPSTERLEPLVRRYLDLDPEEPIPAGALAAAGARSETIIRTLEHVDAAHGGVEAYLAAHGFPPDAGPFLKEALLVPVA